MGDLLGPDPVLLPGDTEAEGELEAVRLESLRWLFPPTDDLRAAWTRQYPPAQIPERDARAVLARLRVADSIVEPLLEAAGFTEASAPKLQIKRG